MIHQPRKGSLPNPLNSNEAKYASLLNIPPPLRPPFSFNPKHQISRYLVQVRPTFHSDLQQVF